MDKKQEKIDPEVKKAIWKIVVYAVTILASLFAGNVAARNGFTIINKDAYVVTEK